MLRVKRLLAGAGILAAGIGLFNCGGSDQAPPPKAGQDAGSKKTAAKSEVAVEDDDAKKAEKLFVALSGELDNLAEDQPVDPAWLRAKLKAVLELDPSHHVALYNLAVLDLRAGKTAEAKKQFEAVARRHPDFAPARENLAHFYVAEGKPQKARAVYDYFIKKDKANITSRLGMARLLVTEGKYQPAIDLCRKVLQRQADAIEAFRILARAYRAVGNTPMAELIIGRGLKVDRRDPELHYMLAEILSEKANLAAYIDKLKEVIRMRPKWLEVRARLAAIALEYRDFGNAALQYEAIVKERPDDRATLIGLAVSYTGMARFDKAKEIYERLLKKNGRDLDVLWNLAALNHHRFQNYPDAKKYYNAFKKLAPSGDKNRGGIEGIIGEIVKIEKDVERQRKIAERARKKQEAIDKSCELIKKGQPAGKFAAAIGKEEERIETAWGLLTKASEFIVAGDTAQGDATFECAMGILPNSDTAKISGCAPMRIVWTRDILYPLGRIDDALACIDAAVACDEVNADALLIRDQLNEIKIQQEEERKMMEAQSAAPAAAPAPPGAPGKQAPARSKKR